MVTIDANGLSCPEPIILLKKALAGLSTSAGGVLLSVDNRASAAACKRYAESRGLAVETARADGGYELKIKTDEGGVKK